MELLHGAIRTYAWGSRTAIAEFTCRPTPTTHPEAELWFGAHPADPALIETSAGAISLLDHINANPRDQLGPQCDMFQSALPFLVKILAADEPLSLQAHPSAEQAREGYCKEEQLAIPLSSPIRNYPDPNPKPELLVALQPFEVLAGFRPLEQTVEFLTALEVNELDPFINLLTGCPGADYHDKDRLRALFTTWITAPQPDLDTLIPQVLAGAIRYLDNHDDLFNHEARMILMLEERYPGDAGVLAALLLNYICLQPGEAIFLPAGNLHTYLQGMGLEVMANSDNVLRGGLTPKHVDVAELLRILDFTSVTEQELRPSLRQEGCELLYKTPSREFTLSVIHTDHDSIPQPCNLVSVASPQILICSGGTITVATQHQTVQLSQGQAVWVGYCDGPIQFSSTPSSTLYRITLGR